MRLLMATLVDADGPEAEPVTLRVEGGVVGLTLADGTVLEFDYQELVESVLAEGADGFEALGEAS